jgi:CBS domain-containing protein
LLEQDAHEALIVEDGRLVGILTHTDVLRALIARQRDIAEDAPAPGVAVEEEEVQGTPRAEPRAVRARLQDRPVAVDAWDCLIESRARLHELRRR